MKAFRYDTSGRWVKGNTHIHSLVSDGGQSFCEIEKRYAESGYDFLCRTDHRIASKQTDDKYEPEILWIDGVEIDGVDSAGAYYHVVCLGDVLSQTDEMSFNEALSLNSERGAIRILAHPYWSGNNLEDALRWNFEGVEIYNHICDWLNGKGQALVYWEAMLKQNPGVLAISADDAHLTVEHPPMNGGWIMVNVSTFDRDSVLSAVKAGNFYASCGPEIHSMAYDGHHINVEFSPARFVRLVGPGTRGKRAAYCPSGKTLSSVSFEIMPDEWDFTYFEVVDGRGRRAWTNNLFIDQ